MAISNTAPRKSWLVPLALIIIGVACTLLLWHSAKNVFQQLNRSQAMQVHQAAERHISTTAAHYGGTAAILAQALAASENPETTLEDAGKPLLQRLPGLVALERYVPSGPATEPENWHQAQVISTGTSQADPEFSPNEVPHWREVLNNALNNQAPGITAISPGSGVHPQVPSGRPSVQLFWPVSQPGALQDATPEQLLALMLEPQQWLTALPEQMAGAAISYQLFDLGSQGAEPIAMTGSPVGPQADQAHYEDPITFLGRDWLLRTSFAFQLPAETQGFLQAILLFGAALTLLVTLLCLRLMQRAQQFQRASDRATQRWKTEHQASQNAALEKDILGRALNDSEQRTRDFIELSNAFSCELDDEGRIGFISSQVASILDRMPADLADQPLADFMPENERVRFAEALDTCCRNRKTVGLDTWLLEPGGTLCPVSVRMTPVTDGINHCVGYRAVGWRASQGENQLGH